MYRFDERKNDRHLCGSCEFGRLFCLYFLVYEWEEWKKKKVMIEFTVCPPIVENIYCKWLHVEHIGTRVRHTTRPLLLSDFAFDLCAQFWFWSALFVLDIGTHIPYAYRHTRTHTHTPMAHMSGIVCHEHTFNSFYLWWRFKFYLALPGTTTVNE